MTDTDRSRADHLRGLARDQHAPHDLRRTRRRRPVRRRRGDVRALDLPHRARATEHTSRATRAPRQVQAFCEADAALSRRYAAHEARHHQRGHRRRRRPRRRRAATRRCSSRPTCCRSNRSRPVATSTGSNASAAPGGSPTVSSPGSCTATAASTSCGTPTHRRKPRRRGCARDAHGADAVGHELVRRARSPREPHARPADHDFR